MIDYRIRSWREIKAPQCVVVAIETTLPITHEYPFAQLGAVIRTPRCAVALDYERFEVVPCAVVFQRRVFVQQLNE